MKCLIGKVSIICKSSNVKKVGNIWLNISKCKVLSITRGTAQDNAYGLNTLGGTCGLEKVEKMKDLGVTVDEKLKFYDHILDESICG